MKIKSGDFIEIDYVGRIKETNQIFDLTKEDVAREEGINNKSAKYESKIICVGNGDIVKGVDNFLDGKDSGKKYNLELTAEEAFGKKDAKLIKMVPLAVFKKQNMKPFPGLQVNIDGLYGIVRTVSGGRVLVDFNHPLSGKEITYELELRKIITDDEIKIKSIIKGLISKDVDCKITNKIAKIDLEIPPEFQKILGEKIKTLVKNIEKIEFVVKSPEKEQKSSSKANSE
jgi:FKBP-type peptidyl-prolyl cis-trans isomerase 2